MTAPELHEYFQKVTGQKLTLSCLRMQTWAEFVTRGLTAEDLDLVIRWTKVQIARNEGGFSPLSLQFGAMVADLDKFEDRLNVARQSRAARQSQPHAPVKAAPPPAPEEREATPEDIRRQRGEFWEKMGRNRPT